MRAFGSDVSTVRNLGLKSSSRVCFSDAETVETIIRSSEWSYSRVVTITNDNSMCNSMTYNLVSNLIVGADDVICHVDALHPKPDIASAVRTS